LIETNKIVKQAKIVILGVTFKENCPDTRNSKVFDIVTCLNEYGIDVSFVDPQANPIEAKEFYNIDLKSLDTINNADCLIFAVGHDEFKDLSIKNILEMYDNNL